MPCTSAPFEKTAKTPHALLRHLRAKGLGTRGQRDRSLNALAFVGYHRLLIYMRPFQDDQKRFHPHVQFDDVLKVYDFDRRLRLLFLEAIDRIEVGFRAVITNTMAADKSCGPHFYLDAVNFADSAAHRDLLRQVLNLRDKENLALKHYYATYNTPALPPIWVVLEAMTIGQMSRLFCDLHLDHRKRVAARFGFDEAVLITWLKSLTLLRNVCAHHGRLWNASITASAPRYANSIAAEFPPHADRGRIFARAVVAQALLARIDPASDWKDKFKALLATLPSNALAKAGMTSAVLGSPEQWEARPFWRT